MRATQRPALVIGLATALMAFGLAVPTQPVAAEDTVTVIVELHRAPVGPAAARAERHGADFDATEYRQDLLSDQEALLERLEALGIDAAVEVVEATVNDTETVAIPARFTHAFNGVGITVAADATTAIAGLPQVRAVHPNRPVEALLDISVDHIRAPEAWAEQGTQGEGLAVAVIDTGIDWTHPMFGGDPVTPPGDLHPKVKFYLSTTAGVVDGHGHGTHVAGIAAGDQDFGDTINGLALFDGVAPKSDLWGYKVLSDAGTGSSLSVVLAIDDATARGADVINLSLGDETGDPDSASASAVNNANDAGVAVAVAAGNSGPGYSTIGSPAAAHNAVTFGASTDPGDDEYFARLQVDPVESMPIIPLAGSPIPADSQQTLYADCGRALTPADCPLGTAGRIALIERGDTPFTTKAASAEAAGAIAAIIYNNEPGNFAGTLIVVEPGIPVAAMSQANGQRLLELVDATGISSEELMLDWANPNVISDQVAGFSSRGPNNDWVLKPDVVAPGNNITSSVPPVGQLASTDRYAPAGGTSMASPHGAGALSILRSAHPDWEPEWLKTALMNTAVQLTDPADGLPYSIHDQGAGRVDLAAAAATPALMGETHPDGRLARGSVNFGEIHTHGGVVKVERTFLVQDVSGAGGAYALSFQPGDGKGRGGEGRTLPADGFSLKLKPGSVNLSPGGSRTVTVEVTLDGRTLAGGDYEGRIVASGEGTTLVAPLYVRVDNAAAFGSNAPVLEDPGDVDDDGAYTLSWSAVEDAKKYRLQEGTDLANHLSDDAEGDGSAWEADGWTQVPLRSHSPAQSYFSGQGPEQDNTLTTASAVAIPEGASGTVSYWTYYDIEPGFDFGYVEVSDDDGASWQVVDVVNGHSGDWVKRSADLSAFEGETLLVRFRYDSDILVDLGFHEGWYVDDITVDSARWTTIAETGNTHHNVSGQPDGVYAYRVAALFNDRGFGRFLQGPWSNVVDITVQR